MFALIDLEKGMKIQFNMKLKKKKKKKKKKKNRIQIFFFFLFLFFPRRFILSSPFLSYPGVPRGGGASLAGVSVIVEGEGSLDPFPVGLPGHVPLKPVPAVAHSCAHGERREGVLERGARGRPEREALRALGLVGRHQTAQRPNVGLNLVHNGLHNRATRLALERARGLCTLHRNQIKSNQIKWRIIS
jgi:hypothetical protein